MNRLRSLLLAGTAVAVVALATVGQPAPPAAAKMADAATKFLAALTPEQKKKAAFPFDDPHRTGWFFTPQQTKDKQPTRVGVRLEEMTAAQQVAALELLAAGLSKKGFEQAKTIMSLEGVLKELEGPKGAMTRNPAWYFVSVFGDPSKTGPWTWRFEGHHLSVNYTLDKGAVVSAAPLTFGANPADIKGGPRTGLRTLPEIEDRARELIKSLTPDQDQVAKQAKPFPEIKEGQPKADDGSPVGITLAKLTPPQQQTLRALLTAYLDRLPEDLAAAERKKTEGPADGITFAYSGSPVPGQPYTYRVYGPGFVVEFLNVQADSAGNKANHIHSAWRRTPDDFALAK